MEELPQITLEEITDTITNIISVCSEAYIIVREGSETPEADYDRIAMDALLHWQPEVNRILESDHPNIGDLHALNNLLSCLTLTPEEYEGVYGNQLEDLCIACYDYEPFEPFLEGEFGTSLHDYLDQVIFAEAGDEDANIPQSQYMVVG
jgi:hypothetical protein